MDIHVGDNCYTGLPRIKTGRVLKETLSGIE